MTIKSNKNNFYLSYQYEILKNENRQVLRIKKIKIKILSLYIFDEIDSALMIIII